MTVQQTPEIPNLGRVQSLTELPRVPLLGVNPVESRLVRKGPNQAQIDFILERLGLTTHSPQYDVLLDLHRLILVAGGERGGKSWIAGLFGATRTPYGELFWIVGPDYELARPEFEYWVDFLGRLGAIRSERDISIPKIGKASAVTKTGQVIETKTSDDIKKIAARSPDGILMTEAAQQDYDIFLKCLGRLTETRGWLLMSGTFEDVSRWYVDKFEDWSDPENFEGGIAYSMPTWSNTQIFPGGRNDPEIVRMESIYSRVEGLFEERLGATPIPPTNLVFREFRNSIHVTPNAHYDSKLPVYLAIDPSDGSKPYSVLACQFHKHLRKVAHPDPIDYCHVIDEVYLTGKIGEDIIKECQRKIWWKRVEGGAIDPEAPDERRRWLKYGKITLHSEKIPQLEGIRRLKSFLHYKTNPETHLIIETPHLYISPLVKSLPFEFRKYKREKPSDDDREMRTLPPSDQPNHSIKALWYLLIARYGVVKAVPMFKPTYNWKRRK